MNGLAASTAAPDIEFLVARRTMRRGSQPREDLRDAIRAPGGTSINVEAVAYSRRGQPYRARMRLAALQTSEIRRTFEIVRCLAAFPPAACIACVGCRRRCKAMADISCMS